MAPELQSFSEQRAELIRRKLLEKSTTVPKEKPDDPKYPCPASGGILITQIRCTSITRLPARNHLSCKGCACPWRICKRCLQSGPAEQASLVTDSGRGTCDRHFDASLPIERPLSLPQMKSRYTLQSETEADKSASDDDQEDAEEKRERVRLRALELERDREIWLPKGKALYGALIPIEKTLFSELISGAKPFDIADKLDISHTDIRARITRLYLRLQTPGRNHEKRGSIQYLQEQMQDTEE